MTIGTTKPRLAVGSAEGEVRVDLGMYQARARLWWQPDVAWLPLTMMPTAVV
jgi:hypothetical protein